MHIQYTGGHTALPSLDAHTYTHIKSCTQNEIQGTVLYTTDMTTVHKYRCAKIVSYVYLNDYNRLQ